MTIPKPAHETVVYSEIEEVRRRLKELGLTLEGLQEVVRQGEYARAEATDHDPVTAEGGDAYRYRVRALRDTFCPVGWTKHVEGGLEMIRTSDGSRAVITRGGNADVGVKGTHPQPNRALGGSTKKAVGGGTLMLDPNWFNRGSSSRPSRELFMLLVHRRGDVAQSELSLPSEVDDGQVATWLERVLLPNLNLGGDEAIGRPPLHVDPIDVPLRRKQK
jgi:hypothetical protein